MKRLLLGMPLLFAALVASAPPASAHAELVSTSPTDTSRLTAPPKVVAITFSEDMLTEGAAIVVKTATGDSVDVGETTVDGATVSAPWPANANGGTYIVSWRAVADDGHPEQGTFVFTIEGSSPSPTATPSASPTSAPQPNDTSSSFLPALLGIGVAAAVVTVIALLVRRGRQTP